MLDTIYIHTDGSSNKDKTIGGWAFCLSKKKDDCLIYEDSGKISGTHNTAELSAVLNALYYTTGNHESCRNIVVFTDSRYVSDPIYYDSLRIWENNGWRTSAKTPVANLELWKEMKILLKRLEFRKVKVEVRWVKGHAGNKLNELMDKKAVNARNNGKHNKLYG